MAAGEEAEAEVEVAEEVVAAGVEVEVVAAGVEVVAAAAVVAEEASR